MTKKPDFGPDFGLFDPYLGPKIFLQILPLLVVYRNPTQFTGKLMKQTWENGKKKKKILGLILACFRPNLVPKIFFRGFNLNYMLYIVVSYHCMQFQGKLMNQTSKNGKKTSFGHNFGTFGPNLGPKNFFHGLYLYYILGTIACYHCIQFQGKQMNETCENGWKPSLGPILVHVSPNLTLKNFLWVLHLLEVMHCSKLS